MTSCAVCPSGISGIGVPGSTPRRWPMLFIHVSHTTSGSTLRPRRGEGTP